MSSVRGPVIAGNRSRSRPMIAVGLVDRERRLREVGDPGRILDLERVDVGLALDEHDRGRGLAHRPLDLLVAGVADEHDRVAVGGELDRLAVDLGHERAGGVDRPQPARLGVGVDGRRDAVGGEHRHRALGDRVAELVDEDRPARGEVLDHVLVVDDLLAHVDRRPVEVERALDRLDGAVDAGAVAARRGEQQLLGSGHVPPSLRTSPRTASPLASSDSLATPRSCRRRARASSRTARRSGRSRAPRASGTACGRR